MSLQTLLVCAAACAAAASSFRLRRVDEIGADKLFPPRMHPKTRAAHRRIMSGWKAPVSAPSSPAVYPVAFGADPTGKTDSTSAFAAAMAAVLAHNTSGHKMSEGIADLGGVVLDLQGGDYLVSAPVVVPPYFGNLRIIDGTLRASSTFPANRYVIEVGSSACSNGQGSCNENVGMSGLTVDGSHVAAGCISITAAMGATIDSSSAIFGFTQNGIALFGGHETMITETWVAAYFWDSPYKEKCPPSCGNGIGVFGNDHFVTNVIVFSAQTGVKLTGAANLLSGVHTWNDATGNGGVGIQNDSSQNRFLGCYLDFTDLVMTNAQQIVVTGGFFLGGAQVKFSAPKPNSVIYGTTISSNVWYDTNSAALAVNETVGTWTSITDLVIEGNPLQQGQPAFPASKVSKTLTQSTSNPTSLAFDFSQSLLFPNVPIASAYATVSSVSGQNPFATQTVVSYPLVSLNGQQASVWVSATQSSGQTVAVTLTVDQSKSSSSA